MNFNTAEEQDLERQRNEEARNRKLTEDRQKPHGNSRYAQTEGLKPLRIKKRNKPIIVNDDDEVIDLTRVTRLSDVEKESEIQ